MDLFAKLTKILASKPRSVATTATSIHSLQSQGLFSAPDGSVAMLHESTSPEQFYRHRYGIEGGINMDRGGFGQSSEGTNFGCVFDGVTSGGKVNAYAAQAFTDFSLRFLTEWHSKLEPSCLESTTRLMFQQATSLKNNPRTINASYDAEGGSATAVFVSIRQHDKRLTAHGAALGDAAFIVVSAHTRRATMYNEVHRRGNTARDTGGQLIMCQGVYGDQSMFAVDVQPADFLILTTDGLTDNIDPTELPALLPFIIDSSLFQTIPQFECDTLMSPCTRPHLPTLSDVMRQANTAACEFTRAPHLSDVSCNDAATRVVNYIKWVTAQSRRSEEEYYTVVIHEQSLSRLEQTHEIVMTRQALRERLAQLEAGRKPANIAKTDDCLVLVLHPLCRSIDV